MSARDGAARDERSLSSSPPTAPENVPPWCGCHLVRRRSVPRPCRTPPCDPDGDRRDFIHVLLDASRLIEIPLVGCLILVEHRLVLFRNRVGGLDCLET